MGQPAQPCFTISHVWVLLHLLYEEALKQISFWILWCYINLSNCIHLHLDRFLPFPTLLFSFSTHPNRCTDTGKGREVFLMCIQGPCSRSSFFSELHHVFSGVHSEESTCCLRQAAKKKRCCTFPFFSFRALRLFCALAQSASNSVIDVPLFQMTIYQINWNMSTNQSGNQENGLEEPYLVVSV